MKLKIPQWLISKWQVSDKFEHGHGNDIVHIAEDFVEFDLRGNGETQIQNAAYKRSWEITNIITQQDDGHCYNVLFDTENLKGVNFVFFNKSDTLINFIYASDAFGIIIGDMTKR
jgi:hypothetical protein